MNKRVLVTLMIFLGSLLFLKSQSFYDFSKTVREFDIYQSTVGGRITKYELPYADIKGSPYLNAQFVESELISNDSIRYIHVKFRYNIFADQMEYLAGEEILTLVNPLEFKYFILDEDIFVYQAFVSVTSKPQRGYFCLLFSGPSVSLSKKMTVVYEPAEELQAFAEPKPARFTRKSDKYYLTFPNGLPVEVSMNRKKVIEAFPDKKSELQKYISEKRLKFRNEADLLSLVSFYNNLNIQ
jgi:hypothetical protein